MDTPRKRLIKKINPTRGQRGDLSPEERAMVIHALLSGEKASTLASRFLVRRKFNTCRVQCIQWPFTLNRPHLLLTAPRDSPIPQLCLR